MLKWLGVIGGWQGYAATAALAALLAGGAACYLTALGYRLTIADLKLAQANAAVQAANQSLKQFETDAAAIHGAAAAFDGARNDLSAKLGTISKDFASAVKSHPLPVDCKPSADRLRLLSGAVAATNSTIGQQLGATVPTHP